jgi:hypothetical protein
MIYFESGNKTASNRCSFSSIRTKKISELFVVESRHLKLLIQSSCTINNRLRIFEQRESKTTGNSDARSIITRIQGIYLIFIDILMRYICDFHIEASSCNYGRNSFIGLFFSCVSAQTRWQSKLRCPKINSDETRHLYN